MHRIGADCVCLKGSALQDSVLIPNHKQGQVSARLEPIDPDAIWKRLEDIGGDRPDGDLSAWVERFRADKWAAGRAYWDELRAGIAEASAAGLDAIPDQKASEAAVKVAEMGKQ